MIPTNLETDATSDDYTESEDFSTTPQTSRNRGGAEQKKKPKKLRSIRLSRLPSRRLFIRLGESQSDYHPIILSSDTASSEQSTSSEISDMSSSSDSRKGSSLASPCCSESSSGGMELKKKLKSELANFESSRKSTRPAKSRHNQPSPVLSGEAEADASPNYFKATSSSDARKLHSKASTPNSVSGSDSNDKNRKSLSQSKPNSGLPGNKLKSLTRKSSMKPVRVLTKVVSLKPKRSSVRKGSVVSQFPDKATCSSILKGSKLPDDVEIEPAGGGVSVKKVCPYTYCSLHGHKHDTSPPLKRFLSTRRRQLRSQKGTKPENHSTERAKQSGNKKKRSQNSQNVNNCNPVVQETGYAGTKAKSKEVGSYAGEDEATIDFGNLSEVVLGETSYPLINVRESLQPISNFNEAEQKNLATLSTLEGRSVECCCIRRELDKETSKATGVEWKEEDIPASSLDNAHNNSILTDGQPVFTPELEDSELRDKLSLKPNRSVGTCHTGIPMDENVHQELQEECSSLNLTSAIGDSELNSKNSEADDLCCVTNGPLSKPEDVVEPTAITSVATSASVSNSLQEPSTAIGERTRDSAPDDVCPEEFPLPRVSNPQSSTDEESNSQFEKQNYSSLWNLIYQRMAPDIASKDGPLDEVNKGKKEEDANTLLRMNSSGSYGDAGNQEIELNQTDAIKLVQEAINSILFPEVREHSSDEQSITSDNISDQELYEKHHGEDEELGISTSTSLGKDEFGEADRTEVKSRMLQDEERLLKPMINTVPDEEKRASKEINKSKQIASKRWSNLKKFILLKRFVKALERMRNFNPKKPQYLPLEPGPEAEKVYLRRQTTEEKKNTEEWMLDYALRQVISKLGPAQKKRVALLVNAFETVIPPAETGTARLRTNLGASSPANPTQACTGSSEQSGEATGKETKDGNLADILHGQTSPDVSIKMHQDQAFNSLPAEQHSPVVFPEIEGTTSRCCIEVESEATDTDQIDRVSLDNEDNKFICTGNQHDAIGSCLPEPQDSASCATQTLKLDDIISTSHENVPVNGELQVPRAILSNPSVSNSKAMESASITSSNCKQFDMSRSSTPESNKGSTAINSVVSSDSVLETLEPTTATYKMNAEVKQANKVFPEFSPPEEPEPDCSTDATPETPMGKQNYTRLWYLVYKHMASDVTATDGTQPPDEADKKGQVDVQTDISGSWQDLSEADQDVRMENDKADNQKKKLQDEAVKLVQEAIDQILLPEVEYRFSDDQSVSSDTTPDQELLEKNSEREELSISTSSFSIKDNCRDSEKMKVENSTAADPGEVLLSSQNITKQGDKTLLKQGSKSNTQAPKSWSNLKKIILLRRFVKALEKVRKLNPREPRYLPLEPNPEAEKVNLKHQDMEDRKNAEEWMLDYAIQQVVTKLTPARKKKVQLLVEAFETVTPQMETETSLKRNTVASPRANPFKSVLSH